MSDFYNYAWTTFEKSFESTSKSGGLDLETRRENRTRLGMFERCHSPITYVSPPRVLSRCLLGAETPSSPHAKSNYGTRDRPSNRLKSKERERGMEGGRMRRGLLFSLAESPRREYRSQIWNENLRRARGIIRRNEERRERGQERRQAD